MMYIMKDFKDALREVKDSKPYSGFCNAHPDFYLAHGFLQLDGNRSVTKKWQIGYYSTKEDKLAVFNTEPVLLQPLEDAFKDGGIISELTDCNSFKTTTEILTIVEDELAQEAYTKDIPTSFIVIVQVIDNIQVYNITAVTTSFSMITFRIDANTGEKISVVKRSILDLKKDDE